MTTELELPDDAERIQVDAKADGVYIQIDVLDGSWRLLESHTYSDGPEGSRGYKDDL